MKVVDTFLFSEAYEAELLLTKLHLESPLVDEFVLIESSQTFRGEEKGLQARKMLESDERFSRFLSRITVFSHPGRLFEGPPGYNTYYQNEERSRASCQAHVLANYSDEDWVIVSDVDEAVDCCDTDRRCQFTECLSRSAGNSASLEFGHYRYWYDFDNRCYWTGIRTPVIQVGTIRRGLGSLNCRSRPRHTVQLPAGDRPLFFEYTFCFPAEACWRKLNSFIHDGYTVEELEKSLATNHWVKSAARGERPGERGDEDWFETVELTEQNSPQYVRDNLARLKTNLIPKDYRENRKRLYGK
jgi:hypothetical protein